MITPTAPADLDPERALIGCLLRLPYPAARRVLAGMRADDCGHPIAAHVLQLVIELVAEGQRPEPVTVFTRALSTGRVTGDEQAHRLTRWLIETHHIAPAPAAAGYFKAAVLEHAWRRALAAHATRIQQAATTCDVTVLREVADNTTTTDELWTRYQAALDTPPATDRLEVAA